MISPGDRCPNLVLGPAEAPWQLYDGACGRAVLLLDGTHPALSSHAVAAAVTNASAAGAEVYWLVPPAGAADPPPTGARAAPDLRGQAARLLQGEGGAGGGRIAAVALNRNHRVLAVCQEAAGLAELADTLAATLSQAADRRVTTAAPVLFVPQVFEPELCRELIAHFETGAHADSPMPGKDGGAGAVDPKAKVRKDLSLGDDPLGRRVSATLARRLLPEVQKAFFYRPTRFERPKLVRYDAEQGGHFHVHRDNPSPQTAHRRFAVSLNLNDDFEGGDLVFPEYDDRCYAPPAGGALVFGCAHAHAVRPVTAGRRHALITFLYHMPKDQ